MVKSQNEVYEFYKNMKNGIEKAGCSFFQYRACNLNLNTIYDLENIQNGVVFARSPLYMNDPFDSMIGFSTEKLYQEFCNMVLSMIPDEMTRTFVGVLLNEKAIGKVAEFLSTIKVFQAFLRVQKNKMNPSEPNTSTFAIRHCNFLFKKMSPTLKKKIRNTKVFTALAFYIGDIDLSMITEQNILQMFQVDKTILSLLEKFDEVKEKHYIPQFKDFLRKMTISCFSTSGWDNQLMWSHYANCYSGICVEYDFSTVNETTGFVFPVKYSYERPTITLGDLGFSVTKDKKLELKTGKVDTNAIMSYLLTKNKCWEYEKEWRIICIGEEDTPRFIEMPKIKSITLGLKLNSICKHLLFDICLDKGIPCYDLVLDTEKFALSRELINIENHEFDMEDEISYIQHICQHIVGIGNKMEGIDDEDLFDIETKYFNASRFFSLLSQINDLLFYVYCLKKAVNSYIRYADDTLTEDIYTEIEENAKQVDGLTNKLNVQPLDVIKGINNLKMAGIVSLDIHNRAITMLQTNNELQERIKAIEWDSRIDLK